MGGWGPYSVLGICHLFEDHDFYERAAGVVESGERRTTAAEYVDRIDWDNMAERQRLLRIIDDVLDHFPEDAEPGPDRTKGERLRRTLARAREPAPGDDVLADILQALDAEHVDIAWQKALDRRSRDPEGAITAARTMLESTCKLILDDLDLEYSTKADLPELYKTVAGSLRLAPEDHLEQAFKQILGGCMTVVNGLATLRNRLGDSHGQGAKPVRPSSRHANLTVNLAGAVAAFLVETWQARPPTPTPKK